MWKKTFFVSFGNYVNKIESKDGKLENTRGRGRPRGE